MDKPAYEYLLSDSKTAVVDAAWAAIGSRYDVVPGPRRQQNRTWLDTFDGRLRAAGLSLAYLAPSGARRGTAPTARHGELVLTDAAGPVLRQPGVSRWPSLATALPVGPVTDRLRPVAGIRALLPVARVRGGLAEWRILDAEHKTVLRAYLEQPAVIGGDGAALPALPARVSLVPIRGYRQHADRVARLLSTVEGLSADAPAELELLLAARPGPGPTARPRGGFRADQDAGTVLASLLLHLLATVELNVPGTIDDVDTEFLHDLRVAVRRTRSALKLAGDVLPGTLAGEFASEFRWLGDLTTPMRDLDTFLLGFDAMAGELTEADRADLEPLRAYVLRQRAAERRKLVRGLRSARFAALADRWRAALTGLTADVADLPRGGPRRTGRAGSTAGALAAQRIARAHRRVTRRAAAIGPGSPPEALHDLRKRCKELRYVLDLFAGVCRPEPYRALIRELKAVQDHLGEFQDAEVHRDAVRAYAVQMLTAGLAEAPTMLAMGELVAYFGARQRRAAAESVARTGQLTTEENRRRVAGLVGAA